MNLSIKDVPEEIVARLKSRAKSHHRSLQGELLAILEETTSSRITVRQAYQQIHDLGLRTASDSAAIIRELRDGR